MTSLMRWPVKIYALLAGAAYKRPGKGVFFLTYHKVDGRTGLELDLSVQQFRRQIEFLANTGNVATFDEAIDILQKGRKVDHDLFVLTFDDGYLDFYTNVFPLLQEFQLPATVYVTTGFVESGITYPLALINRSDFPARWDMLKEMAESGLVSIGAHTHTHPFLHLEPDQRIVDELTTPIDLFQQRIGIRVKHFAYPGGSWDSRTQAFVERYYDSAVLGVGEIAYSQSFDRYRIPRVPIRRSDSWFFFQAKLRGWLRQEETAYKTLRTNLVSDLYRRFLSGKHQT